MIRRILCALGFHSYFVMQKLTPWSRRVGCRCCDRTWGMNDDVRAFVRWDAELEALYRDVYGITIKGSNE